MAAKYALIAGVDRHQRELGSIGVQALQLPASPCLLQSLGATMAVAAQQLLRLS